MKLRTLIGGKLAGLRDYLMAEDCVIPKGLRGGSPVQIDGWPPIVDAKFYVMPKWMRWWVIVSPIAVLAYLWFEVRAERLALERLATTMELRSQEKPDALDHR